MKTLLSMLAIGIVAGVFLAGTHLLTKDRIAQNRDSAAAARLAGLVPSLDEAELCRLGLRLIESETSGYGGLMTVVAAFEGDQLHGVRVTRHQETPGYAEILDPENWIGRFGKKTESRVDAVSGATITSSAVLRAVRVAVETARKQEVPEPEC